MSDQSIKLTDGNKTVEVKLESGEAYMHEYAISTQLDSPPDQEHEWLKSDTGKWYYYIADGLREYQSGARYQEGKGLVGNPNAQITTENAKELSINGHEAKRQKAIEGMKKAIANKRQLGATIAASADVHEYWGEALGEVMLEPGKNQVAALRLAAEGPLELIGKQTTRLKDAAGNEVSGTSEEIEKVLGVIAKFREGNAS